MTRLDFLVRILPISALVLSMAFAFLAWQGTAPENLLSIGRETVERIKTINAVKAMAYGPPSASIVDRSQRSVPADRVVLSGAVGFSFLISVAIAIVHWLLSLFVLSHTYISANTEQTNPRIQKLFSLLYASVDTVFPFRSDSQSPIKAYSLSAAENQNLKNVTAVRFIGSAVKSAPLKRRLIVLSICVAVWIFWPFNDLGPLVSRPLSMFLGYPVFNWAAIFGASEIAFLIAAKALSTHARQR